MWILCTVALAGSGRVEKAAALAEQAYQERDPLVALSLAHKAIKKDPNNAMAHFVLGNSFDRLSALIEDPEVVRATRAAATLAMQRVVQLAPDTLMGSIARDSLSPDTFQIPEPECSREAIGAYETAERAFSEGDREAARKAYDRALEGCPANGVWWVHSGDAYFPEDLPAALSRYEEGIRRSTCHWQGYRFQSDALLRLGRHEDSFHAATRAVACNPTYAAGWQNAVLATKEMGGTAVVTERFLLPITGRAAQERGPGWSAWWDHRTQHNVQSLADAVAAARAGLAAGPPEGEWALLAKIEAEGQLDFAVLLLMYEPNLRADLTTAHSENREALFTFVERWLFVR